jgi:hypothetical protein
MSQLFKESLVIFLASTVAMMLFFFGISNPLSIRVSGDAMEYLRIADGLGDIKTIANYSGSRTIGFPIFEKVIFQILSTFQETVFVLAWINTIGIAMLLLHVVVSWSFATWAQRDALINNDNTRHLLFFFLATFPVLIGHTTTPVTDTFAIDLVLLGFIFLVKSVRSGDLRSCVFSACFAGVLFGYSILVRPASLIGLVVAMSICGLRSIWGSRTSQVALSISLIACAMLLLPSYLNCFQKYDAFCLQSPKTFNVALSMQDGLKGARVLWSLPNRISGSIPMLTDETMFKKYYQRCELNSIVGFDNTSFTGCLAAQGWSLPAFLMKKWIGLFDYFRFTPYLENATPSWLRILSRTYGALAWLGFSLCFLAVFRLRKVADGSLAKRHFTQNFGMLFLSSYSAILLAQHTVLHTEERYGFPLLPVCAVVLLMRGEWLVLQCRLRNFRPVIYHAVFFLCALVLFYVQISVWDGSVSLAGD